MKANREKYHVLMDANSPTTIKIGERTISNSFRKLLRVQINSQRNFNNYLETIIKISMIHVLARTRPHVCISKRKLLMNAFFKS